MDEDRNIRPGDIVRHFKRETLEKPGLAYLYRVVALANHTETGERLVVYWPLSRDLRQACARPYDMFFSEVDREKYPGIRQKYRFEKVTSAELREALGMVGEEEA